MHDRAISRTVPLAADVESAIATGNHPAVLAAILRPGMEMVVWERAPDPAIAGEIAALPPDAITIKRVSLATPAPGEDHAAHARNAAAYLLSDRGVDLAEFPAWLTDVGLLGALCLQLAGRLAESQRIAVPPVNLRLETLGNDGCPRFHVDRCRLRMICTYRGPGTEWLPGAQVNRAALAEHAPNDRILRDGEPRRLQAFHVGVMKGECFPGNAGHGLVHRSPSIAGSGHTRVLVCLDV